MILRKGKVLYAGNKAGEIREMDDHYEFQYDQAYLESNTAKAISLTLPLQEEPFINQQLSSLKG